ncbi:beta-glucuronidase [Agilicoccus flavus]|uniref:beta-glucuronidase n=1 Tax=Agilicoccus flavus TaxID=2775968 RepID=UPI001CF6A66E|nr:beta-glucuronidase [Agilicoccus flavus]
MLRPQDSATRERKNLDGVWDFRLDTGAVGRDERWFAAPLDDARPMAVPASFNDLVTDSKTREFFGDIWYQRTVRVPRGWAGERILVHLESATHRATVWVDDVEVVSHEGGYLPFEADVTDHVTAGSEFRLTVCVNNTLSFRSIPPGVIEDTPAGRTQLYWHDFFNYAGLHRSVWLSAVPADRVDDVTVVTGFADDARTTGTVDVTVATTGDGGDVELVLRDPAGRTTAMATAPVTAGPTRLEVPDVHPWGIGDGYLYDLEVRLLGEGGDLLDSSHLKVGVRTFEVDGTRLLLNGEPVHLTGFGMHEDHVTVGKKHDPALMIRDFELLRWIGANSFRTSHYPYSEDVLDHADAAGVLVIDETPAVGLNMGLGGGIFGGQGYTTFSPETIGDETREVHAQVIRDLVARDKNHPSVVIWSIANEPESETQGAEDYFRPLFDVAREADPTRPVGFVNVMLAPHGQCRVTQFADLVMLNRYYGWYVHTGDLAGAERAMREELGLWAGDGKPVLMTEYGADTYPGLHQLPARPWSEEYQTELLDMHHRVFDDIDAIVGEQMWNFADFATTSGIMRVGGNKKGAFTRDREPKAVAHLLRHRWTAGRDQ